MPKVARRVLGNSGKGAFEIWERALALEAEGRKIIHLEIGEPEGKTPEHVFSAIKAALDAGRTGYTLAQGTAALRQGVAAYVKRTRGVTVSADRVVTGPGVKGMLFAAALAILEPGDELLVPDPGYPFYRSVNDYTGSRPVSYPLRPKNEFQPVVEDILKCLTPSTRAILLNSPANPTGKIIEKKQLDEIASLAKAHDLWILADEIYAQLYFGAGFPPSIFSNPAVQERTILFDGCSKAYSMTGWRVGFGVFPKELVGPVVNLMSHTISCLPPFIMDAAEAAFCGPQSGVDALRTLYRDRRDVVLDRLWQIEGVRPVTPDGAFYVMVDLRDRIGNDARPFSRALLENGVAVLPGDGLGRQGCGFIRLALTRPVEELDLAMDRIVETLAQF